MISISGFDVPRMGLSLTITNAGNEFRRSGQAGCNRWTSVVMRHDDPIDFTVTTKMALAD